MRDKLIRLLSHVPFHEAGEVPEFVRVDRHPFESIYPQPLLCERANEILRALVI